MDPDVSLVLDFLNTRDAEADTDVLGSEETWRTWASDRGLTADPLPEATRAREALRAAAGDRAADDVAPTVHVPVRTSPSAGGVAFEPSTAVAAVYAAAARLTVLGEWNRIKICPADDCRRAFHDRSRNRSRTWCSMRVCGNRRKARTFRRRSTLSITQMEQPCG